MTRTNLKNITDMLPDRDFLRIHRSYVISLASVVAFSRTRVELSATVDVFGDMPFSKACNLPFTNDVEKSTHHMTRLKTYTRQSWMN